ncbi:MerR family transcriptional regulator [Silvibacterium dinghuense]|nr:MerR family transcriptional regulator [Silvibacterium dinghuense]
MRPMSTFRIQQFATLAGVTVRTLHHYDRLGLLSPAHRSERGYRLYCHEDLGRLERILVLRYLGLSLREIAALLSAPAGHGSGSPEPLAVTLRRQQAALRQRRHGLDRVLGAIEHAQRRAKEEVAEPEWLLYQTILEEIHMQESTDWTEKYYSPKAAEVLRERRAAMTPEQMAENGRRWKALFDDIQGAIDRNASPDSAEGRMLLARWMRLADEFTQGDPEIGEGWRRMFEDESHWPNDERAARLRETMPKPEYWAFFRQAVQACLRHG